MHIFRSIKTKIIYIGLITTILLTTILISLSYHLSEKTFKKMIDANTFYDVKNYSQFIGGWFKERIDEMEIYSHEPTIKSLDWNKIEPYLTKESKRKSDVYELFFVADNNGNFSTTLQEDIDNDVGNIEDREYFSRVMEGNSVISNPVISRATGKQISVVASPIKDDHGEVIGLVGGTIELDNMFKFISNFKVDDKNSYSYIVNQDGLIITHPNEDLILNYNILENLDLIDQVSNENIGNKILNLENGVVKYTFDGEDSFGYFNDIPYTNGWTIVTKIPEEYLTAPIKRISENLFIVGVIAIIVSILISVFTAKTISDPIIKLKETITENINGNIKKADINTNDEIGILAKSFNHMMEVISDLTYYDPLTKLPTRKIFDEQLGIGIKHCKRNGENLGVMIIGLDKFKYVNDAFGLNIGDRVLKEVSKRIKESLRQEDVISRITGDEFAIFFPEIKSEKDVIQYAERIIDNIKLPFNTKDNNIYLTASAGIAFYPKDESNRDALIKNANISLHRAKQKGGGSYQLYNANMKRELLEQIEIEKMMSQAIEKEEFSLNYQPIVDLKTLELTGVEALLRWKHPMLGIISPVKFIPIAEENGLIIPLGKWVLKTACKQVKKWHDRGFDNLWVSVNISLRQFKDKYFIQMIKDTLSETGLEPKYLGLEITESVAMENEVYAIEVLKELKNMGIKVAIDDFGTGYSSLEYLTKFPIDTLKIDRSFIWNLNNNNENDVSIASTIIAMGHNLKLEVTAEGVETPEQLEYLKSQKCDNIQGYLFSKPLEYKEFENLLREPTFKNYV